MAHLSRLQAALADAALALTGGYPLLLANLYVPRGTVDLRSAHVIHALIRPCLVFGVRARTSLFAGLRPTVAWYRAEQGGQPS